jgi:hypothetical protein
MTFRWHITAILAVGAVAICAVPAQEPAAAPQAGGKGEPDPFGAGAKPAGKAKAEAAAELAKPEPFAIQVLRDSNPTTPLELLRAAQAVLQYGRPDECKRYLAKFVASKAADEAMAPLTERFGDFLFRLARDKDVQPEGKQAADLILAAAQRAVQNPDRIDALIRQLSAATSGERQAAINQLVKAGPAAVTPMLRALADAGRAKEHPYVQAALVRMAAITELPLIAALETSNDSLKALLIETLGHIRSSRAAVFLVRLASDEDIAPALREAARAALVRSTGAAPDRYEARRYLAREAVRFLRDELPYEVDIDGRIELWSWDDSKLEITSRKLPKPDAAVLLASRAANDLYLLNPTDNAAQRLMLLTNLELAKVLTGLDRPLPMGEGSAGAVAMKLGPKVVSQALADAMHYGRVPAAIAAVEVLQELGDASAFDLADPSASPLADAMIFPDRRLRLAAVLAAVKLAPGASFIGAGRVTQTLGWFAGASGSSYVLVGHPRGEDAQTLVGFMNALGYEGQGAYIGKGLAEQAFVNPDFEFVLIADAIDAPPVKELVQWLRRDFRTARTPVGVMARGELLDDLRESLADDRFTTVFPRLHSVAVAEAEVAKLRAIAGRNYVGRDERIEQARRALAALTVLAKNSDNFGPYELLRQEPAVIHALYNPALTPDAALVLGLLGEPKSQTALVDFASQNTRPLADRQAAAAAFANAVKARGLLLTQPQILAQYDRYNASQTLDKPTQELLSKIIDTIEAPAAGETRLHDK